MGNRVRVSSPHYLCHSFLLRQRSSPAPVLDPFHGLQSFRNCSSTGPFPQGCKSCQQSCSSRQGGQLSLQATGAARRRLQGGLPTGLQPCFRIHLLQHGVPSRAAEGQEPVGRTHVGRVHGELTVCHGRDPILELGERV